MSQIEERLAALGLELPRPPTPIANFLPFRVQGFEMVQPICE